MTNISFSIPAISADLKNELNNVAAIVGLSANATVTAISLGFAVFGQTDEYRVAGIIFGAFFACGTYRLIRDLLRLRK